MDLRQRGANQLTIVGTPGNDVVEIAEDQYHFEDDHTIVIGEGNANWYDTGVKKVGLKIDVKLGNGDDQFFDYFRRSASRGRLRVWGDAGNDTMLLAFLGTRGGFIDGGSGDDTIRTIFVAEATTLRGGAGNDTFYLMGPNITAQGGDGNDSFHFNKSATAGVRMIGGRGSDTFATLVGMGSGSFTLDQLRAISDYNALEDIYSL